MVLLTQNPTLSPAQKVISCVWDDAIKGQVHDSYSGTGATSSDLCLIGDARDLGIHKQQR